MQVTTVGLDLAKNVFQVHGVNEHGKVVLRKQLQARPSCGVLRQPLRRVWSEWRRARSAHHWARKLQALGHTVQADGTAVREALRQEQQERRGRRRGDLRGRGSADMRFVPVKNVEQQSVLALHRVRQGFVKARTAQANQIRGLLGRVRARSFRRASRISLNRVPDTHRGCGERTAWHRSGYSSIGCWSICRRLDTAGRGDRGADQGVASDRAMRAGDWRSFRASGRSPRARSWPASAMRRTSITVVSWPRGSAWCRDSTPAVARPTLLGMSKRGDAYLRTMLIHGASSVIYRARQTSRCRKAGWSSSPTRRNKNVAAVALANKNAQDRLGAAGPRPGVPRPATHAAQRAAIS